MLSGFLVCPFKQKDPKKTDAATTKKKENAETKRQRKRSVGAVVFTNSVRNFWGGLQKWWFCWQPYKNRGFSIFWERKKGPKMWKRLSRESIQGWVKILFKHVAQHNWTDFWLKKMVFFLSFFLFLKNLILLAERRRFWQNKQGKKRRKIWTDVWLKEQFWTDFWLLLYHFFAFWRVRNCTTVFQQHLFLQQPETKWKLETVPPGSSFLYHFWG